MIAIINGIVFLRFAVEVGETFPAFVSRDAQEQFISLVFLSDRDPVFNLWPWSNWHPFGEDNLNDLTNVAPNVENVNTSLAAITQETGILLLISKKQSKVKLKVLSEINHDKDHASSSIFLLLTHHRTKTKFNDFNLVEYRDGVNWFVFAQMMYIIIPGSLITKLFIDIKFIHQATYSDIICTPSNLTEQI